MVLLSYFSEMCNDRRKILENFFCNRAFGWLVIIDYSNDSFEMCHITSLWHYLKVMCTDKRSARAGCFTTGPARKRNWNFGPSLARPGQFFFRFWPKQLGFIDIGILLDWASHSNARMSPWFCYEPVTAAMIVAKRSEARVFIRWI